MNSHKNNGSLNEFQAMTYPIAGLAIDAISDRVFVLNTNYEITLWNKANELVTGIDKETVLGKKLFDVFPDIQNYPNISKGITHALSGRTYFIPASKNVYGNGYYETYFVPLRDEQQQIIGIVSIQHDVAHRIKTEVELTNLNRSLALKNKQLQQRNNELASISYITSHDLREPLRKIHTFIEMLKEKEQLHLSESGASYFKRIQAAAKRMALLTDDILAYSQLSINENEIEEVDLNDVLNIVQRSMSKHVKEKKAVFHIAKLPIIKGDKKLLKLLFEHIVSNALKFQAPDIVPHITINSRCVKGDKLDYQDALPDVAYVEISITDNGIGFDKKYANKVFHVFQRLHGINEYPGSGIGLSIAKKVVELHQGFITAAGETGNGSTFYCFFPENL